MISYDIIGDVHGHADKLEILLQKMGYIRRRGVYRHPEGRTAIFVGDLIDRGPKIRETLHLVKDMCDEGRAMVVMGNHEFNAISFHTPHTEKGGFFRDHTLVEIEQHIETMRQFNTFKKEWDYFIEWFMQMPLYLDLGHLRVVHACWDPMHIAWLQQHYEGITAELLAKANNKKSRDGLYTVINETLKGKELELPGGGTFVDKAGVVRSESRIKWWVGEGAARTYGDCLMDCPPALKNEVISPDQEIYAYRENIPVFFGHYWLKGQPNNNDVQSNAVCLDYSVAKEGKLVACQFEADDDGNATRSFVWA